MQSAAEHKHAAAVAAAGAATNPLPRASTSTISLPSVDSSPAATSNSTSTPVPSAAAAAATTPFHTTDTTAGPSPLPTTASAPVADVTSLTATDAVIHESMPGVSNASNVASTSTSTAVDTLNRLSVDSSVALTSASFKWMKPLGRGQFGRVYKAREKMTGERGTVALKVMEKHMLSERGMTTQVHLERRVHSLCSGHENICSYLGFFECPKRRALVLVLEHCVGGTLFDEMKTKRKNRFDEATAAKYISSLARALSHVHAAGFLHRDLKPENVLLDQDGVPKLADFGWAFDGLESDERCGSLDYMSPQMVQLEDYETDVDAWALGVLGYELLVGTPPFERDGERDVDVGQMRENTMRRIVDVEYTWPQRPGVSKDARNCIDGLLKKNQLDRLTLRQVLEHPWILKHTGKQCG